MLGLFPGMPGVFNWTWCGNKGSSYIYATHIIGPCGGHLSLIRETLDRVVLVTTLSGKFRDVPGPSEAHTNTTRESRERGNEPIIE